jgi:ribonuclease E
MLIDSSHAEETRVVVATGNRLDEFDFETSTRKQLKGNIYLAKVTRVEPSLQAAFVDYGGNRHGFLPFSEIHPDYYQIPVSDREALFREQEEAAAAAEADAEAESDDDSAAPPPDAAPPPSGEDDGAAAGREPPDGEAEPAADHEIEARPDTAESYEAAPADPVDSEPPESWHDETADDPGDEPPPAWAALDSPAPPQLSRKVEDDGTPAEAAPAAAVQGEFGIPTPPAEAEAGAFGNEAYPASEAEHDLAPPPAQDGEFGATGEAAPDAEAAPAADDTGGEAVEGMRAPPALGEGAARERERDSVEEVGGDEIDEMERRRTVVSRSLLSRRYKIQEVIKKRQIMLVQVVKEERGTKGAALTTYLSLAGRYCVLMPNAVRGGGISRKIVNAEDRRRLKAITAELQVPSRMGLIVRTAGLNRTKPEIKRDFEYLMRQWESIRELTLSSTAPCVIYEEANLIRRSIRDLYTKEIDEILVEGDEGYRIAKDFMRTLIPSHTSKVQPYRDRVPLFVRYQIESQLDSMYSPHVQLRSGGYLVINQAEALVAIDVNSGRSTRERNIEETATRTNLEAADEIARQLRLRDLAGLIVIDFIDMDENRNQRAVERRLKEALKTDRARIQVGRISAFGLLEMSRQRLRPSIAETSMETCHACGGSGLLRSTESAALHVLRAIEEEGLRGRAAEIRVHVPTRVAMYVLNHKRKALADIETRYEFSAAFVEDNTLIPPGHEIERVRARSEPPQPLEARTTAPISADMADLPELPEGEAEAAEPVEEAPQSATEPAEEAATEASTERRTRRRRRQHGEPSARERRRGAERPVKEPSESEAPVVAAAGEGAAEQEEEREEAEAVAESGEDEAGKIARRRRRGRRGGRRRRGRNGAMAAEAEAGAVPAPAEDGEAAERPEDGTVAASPEGEDASRERGPRMRRGRRGGRRGRAAGTAHDVGSDAAAVSAEGVEPAAPERPRGDETAEDEIPPAPRAEAPSEEIVHARPDEHETPSGAAIEPRSGTARDRAEESAVVEQPSPRQSDDGNGSDEQPSFGSIDEQARPSSGPPRRGWWQRVLTGR